MLAKFGWSGRAEQVWELLLRGPLSTVEIIGALGLDRSEAPLIEQILHDLAATTIVVGSKTGDGRWDALDPREAHRVLLRRAEQDWKQKYEQLDSLGPSLTANLDQFLKSRSRSDDQVETLVGGAAVRARLSQLRASATHSVRSMAAPHSDGGPPEFNSDTVELLARGIAVDVIIDSMTASLPAFVASLIEPGMEALEARVLPVIPLRMMIVDEIATVPIDPHNPALGAYVVHGGLAAPAVALMDALWSTSSKLNHENCDLHGLTPRERQVCQVLIHGGTDDQIARRVGLSARTVRKIIASVEEKLDVTNRTVLAYHLGTTSLLSRDTPIQPSHHG